MGTANCCTRFATSELSGIKKILCRLAGKVPRKYERVKLMRRTRAQRVHSLRVPKKATEIRPLSLGEVHHRLACPCPFFMQCQANTWRDTSHSDGHHAVNTAWSKISEARTISTRIAEGGN
eukprot:5778606-Amphidinium_carterae.1